jgi:hypothetical protein
MEFGHWERQNPEEQSIFYYLNIKRFAEIPQNARRTAWLVGSQPRLPNWPGFALRLSRQDIYSPLATPNVYH